ncbi:hypothetical protein [Streptomyces sp. NPDC057939]|uniref:hypothetical protein n=1 Tax=Streptomyces sp. NPDC057939 TaxID=3346284 RepID=UPI0036ECF07A
MWLVPGVEHHYGPGAGGWGECFVDFTGSAVEAYTDLGYVTPDRPLVALSATDGVRHVVDGIVRATRRGGPLLEVEATAALHALLVALRHARAEVSRHGDAVPEAPARDALRPSRSRSTPRGWGSRCRNCAAPSVAPPTRGSRSTCSASG